MIASLIKYPQSWNVRIGCLSKYHFLLICYVQFSFCKHEKHMSLTELKTNWTQKPFLSRLKSLIALSMPYIICPLFPFSIETFFFSCECVRSCKSSSSWSNQRLDWVRHDSRNIWVSTGFLFFFYFQPSLCIILFSPDPTKWISVLRAFRYPYPISNPMWFIRETLLRHTELGPIGWVE